MPRTSVIENLAVSPTGFVFDPRSGATFTLNPTGLAVLLALREGLPVDRVVAKVREGFDDAPTEEVRGDVVDFVHVLQQHGLLPPDFTL